MQAGFYAAYATRSLVRGGQRTLLAIFCIAVGSLSLVALQLVGGMVNHALTDNIRAVNGGDLSVMSPTTPLPQTDLAKFDRLVSEGVLTHYTAVAQVGVQLTDPQGAIHASQLWAVDPATFPLTGAPAFSSPADGDLAALLQGGGVVVTENVLTNQHARVGDRALLHTTGRSFTATIVGAIKNTALFSSETMLMGRASFAALPTTDPTPLGYQVVYADAPQHTDAAATTAKQRLQAALPLTTVTTANDTLQQSHQMVQLIRYFLQVVGLLALLIGGIGVVNTMQVMLQRRQTEIAMLKTAGYQRWRLSLLYGAEAGLLGLLGGAIGAAAGVGVSFLVKGLVEKAFNLTLPTTIDPAIVLSGVAIGFVTALIFGLLPIVQASGVRPVAVLRGGGEQTKNGIGLSLLLGGVVVALFFALALTIVQSAPVAAGAVLGGGALLVLLSLAFAVIALLIGRLPLPDHVTWRFVLLVGVSLALAIALTVVIPAAGVLLLLVALFGVLAGLAPRGEKATMRMALHNIGRKKTRSSTTLVALFVGVFSIGLIVTLGQNIESAITSLSTTYTAGYNTFINASSDDKAAVDQALAKAPGITKQTVYASAASMPVALNGTPIAQALAGQSPAQAQTLVVTLEGVTGYNLAQGQIPTESIVQGDGDTQIGRTLTSADAGANVAMVSHSLSQAPFNLRLGDQVTIAGPDGVTTTTLAIVGFFTPSTTFGALSHPVLSDVAVANTLTHGHPLYVYSLVIAPSQADHALHNIQQAVPSALVISLALELNIYLGLLNNLLIMFTAVASLALLASFIIIANAVALAMLERRRELGILKALGYTSPRVLGGVLLENGIVGFVGSMLAMLLATLGASILANTVFRLNLNVNLALILGIVGATTAACMLVAGVVAWGATRVRPLEVLRYE